MEVAAALMQGRQVTRAAGYQIYGPAQPRFGEIFIDVRVVKVQAGFGHGASGYWAVNHQRHNLPGDDATADPQSLVTVAVSRGPFAGAKFGTSQAEPAQAGAAVPSGMAGVRTRYVIFDSGYGLYSR